MAVSDKVLENERRENLQVSISLVIASSPFTSLSLPFSQALPSSVTHFISTLLLPNTLPLNSTRIDHTERDLQLGVRPPHAALLEQAPSSSQHSDITAAHSAVPHPPPLLSSNPLFRGRAVTELQENQILEQKKRRKKLRNGNAQTTEASGRERLRARLAE